ncbi:MAG: ankyrin repeat domain-containing protein [Alphaproteobacteria bacterium]
MADRTFTAAAALPQSPLPEGRCRIDCWSGDGWHPVADVGDRADPHDALDELRRREPKTLFRIVRPLDMASPLAGTSQSPPPAPRPEPRVRAAPPAKPARRRYPAQLAGALGLVSLVALACAAHWSAPAVPELTSRSAAAKPMDAPGSPPLGESPAAPAADGVAAATPALLAGRWSAAGSDCSLGEVRFLPDRELRIAADGGQRAIAVAGYLPAADAQVLVAYVGGATASYAAAADRLTLQRARIAQIDISPQQPMVLERCVGPSPVADPGLQAGEPALDRLANTPAVAFRLAVQVADDLAATLALARGLRPTESLGAGSAQSPLAWAVSHGRAVLVGKLVAAGADPNAVDAEGVTLLSQAVRRADVAVVEALLAAGADPRLPDPDGRRPIEVAAALDHQLLIDLLFAARR